MSDGTAIQWSDATWSPTTGCTRVSEGCRNCYITTTPPFRMNGIRFTGPGHTPECRTLTASEWDRTREAIECTCPTSHAIGATTGVRLHEDRLNQPLHWRKPRRVFVNSLSDLFHQDVPDEFIARTWAAMAASPRHTFQCLTKRHARMRALLSSERFVEAVQLAAHRDKWGWPSGIEAPGVRSLWPLRNVHLGVSVEDQRAADLRIGALLGTPASVRWLSMEPLLGQVRLRTGCYQMAPGGETHGTSLDGIDWVVVGGESGPNARPMDLDWVRDIIAQCRAAGVPVFVKQLGTVWARDTWVGGRSVYAAGDRKGGNMRNWPADIRIREYPGGAL